MPSQNPARVMREIGRRVAELREARGWTQAVLAERLDVSASYVRRIEAGSENLSIRSLVGIAGVLGARVVSLFEPPESLRRRPRGRPPRASGTSG